MCGIVGMAGFARLDPDALRERLRAMGRTQMHRGPDGWGEWVLPGVALGHNRLAIIDLECGAQPMSDGDGRVHVVFNGEIYNFRELRAELSALGHTFHTDHADTEVIVHGYKQWGTGVFERLEGMFGLAIWDSATRRLVLARDRAGIKPLFFAPTPEGILFASEPKAILASGLVAPALRSAGLLDYFMFRAPVDPGTLFEGIEKLAPGCWLAFDEKGISPQTQYWNRSARIESPRRLRDAEEFLLAELDAAVQSHLIADVPVGVFLSGGVDSSLIAALIARHVKLDAFTVGSDSPLDESGYARTVAKHLGQQLHVRQVTPADFLGRFESWAYYNDDPVADPSALALMVLAEHARGSGMTVMLAGEGADELFGGYNSYQRYAFFNALGKAPGAGALGRAVADRVGGKDGDYLRNLDAPRFLGHAHISDYATRRNLFARGFAPDVDAWEARAFAGAAANGDAARAAMLFDQRVRLPNDVLARTDRATMAASLEARVPFLDRRIIEVANAMPRDWCVRLLPRLEGKWILKRVAAREVPPEVVYRPKLGFELPMEEWLRGEFRERVQSLLADRAIAQLDYDYLAQLYASPARWPKRWAAVVWSWLVLEEWYRLWIRGAAVQPQPFVKPADGAYPASSASPILVQTP